MDPWTVGAIATGAADFLGGIFSNRANRREARRNRQFQERMSSSSAQRSVEDYARAGLNPALAYDRPASTPGGSQAQLENPAGKAASSAMAVKQLQSQLKLNDQAALKMAAETAKTKVDGANALLQGDLLSKDNLLKSQELAFRTAIQPHQTRAAAIANIQAQFGLSKAKAESQYYEMMGVAGPMIDQLSGPVGGAAAGALGAFGLLRRGGMAASSAKSLQGLFRPPAPRRTGDWERLKKVQMGPRRAP